MENIETHPLVSIIWNFYPLNWFILPPVDWTLNFLVLPITIFTWPLWWIWNILNLPWAILFFPVWLVGFALVLFFSGFGWLALLIIRVPLWIFLFFYVLASIFFTGSPIYVPALIAGGITIVLTIAAAAFLIAAFPVGGFISLIIWATLPCVNEDAAG